MARSGHAASISSAAGLSAGTGFSGAVMLLPDGVLKSLLLILAPTITIIISSGWYLVTQEIEARVADWRVRSEKSRAQNLYERLVAHGTDPEVISKAKKNLDALSILEVEITMKRATAILSPASITDDT